MKWIIDISDDDLSSLNSYVSFNDNHDGRILKAVRNGISLKDIIAEIQQTADDEWNKQVGSVSQGLEDAIEIIENRIDDINRRKMNDI